MRGDGAPLEAPVSPRSRIGWGVFIVHAALLLALCTHHFFSGPLVKKGMKITAVREARPLPKVSSAPKTAPKAAAPESAAQKTKEKPKPPKPQKKPALSPPKKQPERSSPKPLAETAPLSIPAPLKVPDFSLPKESQEPEVPYDEILSLYLQSMLELPEWGSVTVELLLRPNGTLASYRILETKSEKNSAFLKKKLPELRFPCLNKADDEGAISSITVVFKNR